MTTTLPQYLGATTLASNAVQDPTRTTPTHQAFDIGIITTETASQDPSFLQQDGFAEGPDSPQTIGAAGGATSTQMRWYWKRLTSDAEETVQMSRNGGDHIAYIMHLYRGCRQTGNPWDVTSGGTSASSTAVSITGDTTTVDNCLVVVMSTNATNTTTSQWSGWSGTGFVNPQERINQNHTAGNGGGIAVTTGEVATAGAYGPITATLATASVQAWVTVALAPEDNPDEFPAISNPSKGTVAPRSPSFIAQAIRTAKTLADLINVLSRELPRFAQSVMCYELVAAPTFGSSIRVAGNLTRHVLVEASSVSDFTVENPSTPREGVELTFDVHNGTTSPMGVVTWASQFELSQSFTRPAAGKHRLITFYRAASGVWREKYRSGGDVD
jgi:hypothetical protein